MGRGALVPPLPRPTLRRYLQRSCEFMASRASEPGFRPHGIPVSGGCRNTFPPDALASCETPGPFQGPQEPEPQRSCRRRNVLSERERRRRIAASCERLRALLPWFSGRREDMASVLEMAVQFLRLAHVLVPTLGQPVVRAPSPPPVQCRRRRHQRVVQAVLEAPAAAGGPDSGTAGLGLARPWELSHGAPLGMDSSEALSGPQVLSEQGLSQASGARESPELSVSKVPLCPPWTLLSQQSVSPPVSPVPQSWPGLAGGTDPNIRSVVGAEVEEGTALLLAAGPDWWPGPLEGRGSGPLVSADRAEPGSLADSLLEQWGSELGCSGLALREEATNSLLPDDFFACRL